jgi:hypothetical protein
MEKVGSEVVFEGHSAKDNSEDGIDQAYKSHMHWGIAQKSSQTFHQGLLEVRWADRANYGQLALSTRPELR